MARRHHSDSKREEALRLAREDGLAPALIAKRLNVKGGTVRSWLHRAAQDDPTAAVAHTESQQRRNESLRLSWEQRRLTLANELGDAAAEMLEAARARPKARDRKDEVHAVVMLVDRAELLSGRATSRSEVASVDAARESIKRVGGAARDELAERRSKQAA